MVIIKFFIFLIVNFSTFFAFFVLNHKKFKRTLFSEKLIKSFILALTQVVGTTLIFGYFLQALNPVWIIGLNIAITAGLLLFNRKEVRGTVRYFFSELKSFLIDTFSSKLLGFLFILTGALFIYLIFSGIVIGPYSMDDAAYHLPTVLNFWQEGKISFVDTGYYARDFYPFNIELTYLWQLFFIKKDTFLALAQMPFFVFGAIGTYLLGLKAGLQKKTSNIISYIFLFTPVAALHANANYIDLALSTLIIYGAIFALEIIFEKDKEAPYYLILLAAILLGSKYSMIIPVGIFGMIIFYSFIKNQQKLKIFTFGILSFSLLAGPWYLKNYLAVKNPLAPYQFKFGETVIFEGVNGFTRSVKEEMIAQKGPEVRQKTEAEAVKDSLWGRNVLYSLDDRNGGFGSIWSIILMPAALLSFALALFKKDKKFLFLASLFLFLWLPSDGRWWMRYNIFLVAFGAVSFGLLLESFKYKWIDRGITLLLIGLFSYNFAVLLLPKIPIVFQPSDWKTAVKKFPERHFVGEIFSKQFIYFWNLENARIAHSKSFYGMTYSLYGKNFNNKVYYVPNSGQCDLIERDLRSNNIDYYFMVIEFYSDNEMKKFQEIDRCFKDKYKLVFSEGNIFKAYEIKKNQN